MMRVDGVRTPVTRVRLEMLTFYRPGLESARSSVGAEVVDTVTDPEWKRDPFAGMGRVDAPAKPSAVPGNQPVSVVTSILFSAERQAALVDGRVVTAGDRISAGLVKAIERDAVVVEAREGGTRRLQIEPPASRMTARSY
jgi:hypothetical protein